MSFTIGLNLSCFQLKIECYRYKLLYVSLMVTTKQKSIVNTQKRNRKEYKHATKESNQTTTKESKRRIKAQKGTTKTAREQLTKWH